MLLVFLIISFAFAQFDGSTVTCPDGKYSKIGQTPLLRFQSNETYILICGKEGEKKEETYFLREFDTYVYESKTKKLEPFGSTDKYQRFRVYTEGNSLFFEELVYTGAKRVPGFRRALHCSRGGDCSYTAVECIFDSKKAKNLSLPSDLEKRLNDLRCL